MLKSKEYVYAVYQEKSFSKAAEKLFISQPALSAAIKKVENEVQTQLFNRNTNPIQLTPAGEYYIKNIEKVMEIENEMKLHFQELSKNRKKALTIGSSAYFCAHILPSILQEFQRLHSDYTIDLIEANAADLKRGLNDGELDFIIDVDTLDSKFFVSRVLKQESIILAVPSCYRINTTLSKFRLSFDQVKSGAFLDAHYQSVDMGYFMNEPFIFLKKGNDSYKRGMKMCNAAGFKPYVAMYVDQLLTSYYIACGGKGIAFIRAGITKHVEPTDKVCLYKINDALAIRNVMLYYKKTPTGKKEIDDFLTFTNISNLYQSLL